jgi:hypothetical protein
MKELIMNVLEDMSGGQVNFESEAAREMVATTITAALKTKGSYKEYSEYELDEQRARESWVCSICGENTFEVDSDYIGSGTNHLGCELEIEMKNPKESEGFTNRKIQNNYGFKDNENDKKSYINDYVDETDKDKKVDWFDDNDKRVTSDRRESDRREKNWVDKLSEEIVSDNDTNYIYESPDSGETVYKRKIGSDERELVKDWEKIKNNE